MTFQTFLNSLRGPSIRTSLTGLVIICILPTALVATYLIFNSYNLEQAQLRTNLVSRARAMTSAVDRDFANTESALRALSTSPLLEEHDFKLFHAQASAVLGSLQAESIVMLDRSGKLLMTTAIPYGQPIPTLTNPPELKAFLASGRSGASDIFVGPLSKQYIFLISVPVTINGHRLYSLNAAVTPSQLLNVLKEQKLSETWRSAIIDTTGTAAARSHGMDRFSGKKVHPVLLAHLEHANEGAFEATTLDGIPVLTSYSKSATTGWSVALGTPLAEITSGIRKTLLQLSIATFLTLAGGLALAGFVARRISSSIRSLMPPARALGSGEMPDIPRLHLREANELREVLLDAAETIQRATYDARHDPLTGIANRVLFHLVVEHQLALCQRTKSSLSILYIDLDGFKAVNDMHGHAIGDQLLCAVAKRLKDTIRDSDIAARLGGDEFAVALIHSDLTSAANVAMKLLGVISAPYHLDGIEANISASFGVSSYPVSATDVDTLLKNADHAMYTAKDMGKRCVCTSSNGVISHYVTPAP